MFNILIVTYNVLYLGQNPYHSYDSACCWFHLGDTPGARCRNFAEKKWVDTVLTDMVLHGTVSVQHYSHVVRSCRSVCRFGGRWVFCRRPGKQAAFRPVGDSGNRHNR